MFREVDQHMLSLGKVWRPRRLLILLIIALLLMPMLSFSSHASVPVLDNIRVALFIDARGVVPTVTVSSTSSIHIGVRDTSETRHWLTHASDRAMRVSMDQYRIFIMETTDYDTASAAARQVNGLVGEAYVMRQVVEDRTVYRVYIGQFNSEERARNELGRISNLALLQPYQLAVRGPHHLSAGTYQQKEAAKAQLSVLNQHGHHGYMVYHEDESRQPLYSVWLGEAANANQLVQLENEVSAQILGIQLQTADTSIPYIIEQEQMMLDGRLLPHYYFNRTEQVLSLTSDATLRVVERSNRTYRGMLELRQYRGSMAVINELPFEEYLYAVVGSEVSSSWPEEALKAQAVVARTFALAQGMKYGIAHVSDTTYEQAYHGVQAEYPAAVAAVEATKGEVVVDHKGLITTFYYSNAGGMTADTSEIWGTPLDYISVVPSPDQIAEDGLLLWNRVVLPDGMIGYVRSDFMFDSGERNSAGYPIMVATENNVNVRAAPYVNNSTNAPIAQINQGDRLTMFEQTMESNAYSWVQGPYTAEQLQLTITRTSQINLSEGLHTLEVSERGPSGRVTEMLANGKIIPVSSPDSYRTAMSGLRSTRFDVEELGRYTILGAEGQRQLPSSNDQALYVLSADSNEKPVKVTSETMFVLGDGDETRLITQEPHFRFVGLGFGHGIGLSQWGARELAQFLGYDYKEIIDYYYTGTSIVKD